MDHTGDFDSNFTCKDLLPIEELEDYYVKFFDKVLANYGQIPIIYLHFPAKFDDRKQYKERSTYLFDLITKLSVKYTNINSISIDNKFVVRPNNGDNFPYHFSDETIKSFTQRILELNIKDIKKINIDLKYFIRYPRRAVKMLLSLNK